MSGFFNNFTSDNPSVVARLAGALNVRMSCQFNGKLLPLPKLVIIVPDDNLIKILSKGENTPGYAKPQNRIINYIMTQHQRSIATFRETLPAKCVRSGYPHILWIQAPIQCNFRNNALRHKFNKCLEDCVKIHPDVSTLALKCVWDKDDMTLFVEESQRFTANRFKTYWEAVDQTVCYLDSVVLKKKHVIGKKSQLNQKAASAVFSKTFSQKDCTDLNDRFRWQNPVLNVDRDEPVIFRTLPVPPPRWY